MEVQRRVKADDSGVSAKATRRTKTSDVLIELKAKMKDRELFGTAFSRALRNEDGVRRLAPKAKLVI